MSVLNSKDIEYMSYTLGDIGVIELLISFRYKYDDDLFKDNKNAMAVSGAGKVFEEGLVTYASLDSYIKKCKFNEQQLELIRLIEIGYSHEEIAELAKMRKSVITGRLQTIYKRIARQNEWEWRKCVYKYKLDLKSKVCSKCKEELPATPEFYSDNGQSKDGLHSRCKLCRM